MTSNGLLTILLVTACASILMVALCPGSAFSFNRGFAGHPGVASGVAGTQQGNTGILGTGPTQPGTTGIYNFHGPLPNYPICYTRCTASCPGFRTPRDEQQCHQRCAAQCGG